MFQRLAIPDIVLVQPKRHGDARGYFCETYREADYAEHGVHGPFVQDNQAFSEDVGTLRGLHFQVAPTAQGKLISCTQGAIFDVAVDLRSSSASFGQYVGVDLSAENGHQLYIPPGFAHGYLTRSTNCLVQYKVSAYYSPDDERGLAWNDPDIDIAWPLDGRSPILSEKDSDLPGLRAFQSAFA